MIRSSTRRAALALALLLAGMGTAAPAAAAAQAPVARQVPVCVLDRGELREIAATVDSATGDTLVGGRRFAEAYPSTSPPYAAAAEWFVRMQPVVVGGGPYRMKVRYGLERILEPGDLVRIGEYRGIPMFAEPAASKVSPEVVYFPVRPGCVFQPYQSDIVIGGVRG